MNAEQGSIPGLTSGCLHSPPLPASRVKCKGSELCSLLVVSQEEKSALTELSPNGSPVGCLTDTEKPHMCPVENLTNYSSDFVFLLF